MRHTYLLASLLLLGACDDDPAKLAFDGGPADAGDVDATAPGSFQTLIEADWSLEPGEEGYVCATKTLTEDLYIGAIRPVAPVGTHHTVLDITEGGNPDVPAFDCGVEFGQLYASGVGTGELTLPEGVGLVAKKGQQVRLNLHLFNASDGVISGRSGIEVVAMPKEQVVHEARVGLAGPTSLDIPATGQPVTISGDEELPPGYTLFALFPHMHQVGTHFKAELLRGEQVLTVWDRDYQFESQEFELVDPIVTQAGDRLRTSCTYVNNTGAPIHWGDSSTAEMCFSIMMLY